MFFFTLFRLKLKQQLRSPVFLTFSVFFTAFVLGMALLLPVPSSNGPQIGVLFEKQDALSQKMQTLLSENEDYPFVFYSDLSSMTEDVLLGRLHCAYGIRDAVPASLSQECCIDGYYTDGSYLRGLTDEIVLSCFLDATSLYISENYALKSGVAQPSDFPQMESYFRQLSKNGDLMKINLIPVGNVPVHGAPSPSAGTQPLLYAVFISVFLSLSVVCALLQGRKESESLRFLSLTGKRKFSCAFAPALAIGLANIGVLLACDLLLNLCLGAQSLYSFHARLTMLALLGAASYLLMVFLSRIRTGSLAIMALTPLFLLCNICFSGAVFNPDYLPWGLGMLKYFCPGWYGIKILGAL